MKKFNLELITLMVIIFIGSCTYESRVSIDQPVVKIDPALLGTWQCNSTGELGQQQQINEKWTVTKYDEYLYSIKLSKPEKAEATQMFGFISMVKGVVFMNVYDDIPEGSPRGYSFFKVVRADDNTFKVYPLSENIKEHFSSSRDLKNFIEANMMNSYFFEKHLLCKRTNPKN